MSRLWLRITRTVALVSLLAILAPVAWLALSNLYRNRDYRDLIPLILSSVLWVIYIRIIWNLRPAIRSDQDTVKKGLALAIWWGGLIFLLSSSFFYLDFSSCQPDSRGMTYTCFLAILQLFLVAAGIRTYYSMERDSDDWTILIPRSWFAIGGVILSVWLLPALTFHSHGEPNEAVAVASLRTIASAQQKYADIHKDQGYAKSFSDLRAANGPDDSFPLIDATLASGQKCNYIFVLKAGPPEANGRVGKFTVTARPVKYRKCGIRSFFISEKGDFRFTTENRDATIEDDPL